jgi:hypothetical protein
MVTGITCMFMVRAEQAAVTAAIPSAIRCFASVVGCIEHIREQQ